MTKTRRRKCSLCGKRATFHRGKGIDGSVQWFVVSHGCTFGLGVKVFSYESRIRLADFYVGKDGYVRKRRKPK